MESRQRKTRGCPRKEAVGVDAEIGEDMAHDAEKRMLHKMIACHKKLK